MAAKINTVGAITLKNLRREGGAESVDVAASMALKRTFGDTAVTLRLTEAAFTDLKSLNGALLTVSKAVGNGATATAKLDLASRSAVANLMQLRKFDGGRMLETGVVWNSRTKQWLLEAIGKPHPAHKLTVTCNPHTNAVWGALATEWRGFTIVPSYNLAKHAGAVAVSRKLSGGQTLRASYASDSVAVLELANKPFKVGLKTRATRDGLAPFTLGITIEREIALNSSGGAHGSSTGAAAQGAKPGGAGGARPWPGAAARDPTLGDKLAALDAAFETRFASKGANARRFANGIDVVSFRGKPKKA